MEISKNNFKNRFDINGISKPIGKKTGIAGYHGRFWCIIGWIAAKIFHKTVPLKTSKGVYYLNCKSLENWFRRVAPDSTPLERDKGFSRRMHDPDSVAKMIESIKKQAQPISNKTNVDKPQVEQHAKKSSALPTEKDDLQKPQTGRIPDEVTKIAEKNRSLPEDLWRSLEDRTSQLEIEYLMHNDLHRFSLVGCPKNTAIIVDARSLHANKVTEANNSRFHLIASQAPLEETEPLFWQWIFENGYSILDLTTSEDQNSQLPKRHRVTKYYPENINEIFQAHPFFVKLIENEGIRRKYQVVHTSTNESKEVTRFHYSDWQDFGEGSFTIFNQLVEIIEKNPKIWIHCRAGIGRTGTLIAAALLKEKIKEGKITKDNYDESLIDLIIDLRKKRGHGFIQTYDQFHMVHQYGLSFL